MHPPLLPPFTWISSPSGPSLQSTQLAAVAPHLFTTRSLAFRGPTEQADWIALASALAVAPDHVARLKQVHGKAAWAITGHERLAAPAGEGWSAADIILTDVPAVAVAVQAADCVPLLMADTASRAVAAVHAGWRGTAARVAQEAVARVSALFGVRPSDLVVAIGPAIGRCCYQVGSDVFNAFEAAGFDDRSLRQWFTCQQAAGKFRLDVPRANRDQLVAAGVDAANIGMCGLCTACHPELFFSYRRDGAATGRLAAAIRLRAA